MKISDKRSAQLYSSINDPITAMRIINLRKNRGAGLELDNGLADLEQEIWERVKSALNITEV